MLYCCKCGRRYDRRIKNVLKPEAPHHNDTIFYCPSYSCGGTVVELDNNIVPIIQLLYDNNIDTFFSCSGHSTREHISEGYIFLAPTDNARHMMNNIKLPKGFRYEYNKFDDENTDAEEDRPVGGFTYYGMIKHTEYVNVTESHIIRFPNRHRNKYPDDIKYQNAILKDIQTLGRCLERYFEHDRENILHKPGN